MSLNAWLDLAILTSIWIGVAAAWNILAGFAGQFSLGHAAFFGIGAYAPTLFAMRLHQSPWLGIAIAYHTDWPVSFCIAFLSALGYFLTRGNVLPRREATR